MSIPSELNIPIPFGLSIVMWLEFLLFVPFSMQLYFGSFKPFWGKASDNGVVRSTLWSGEMLNGVGAVLLMYMLGSALWQQTISLIEVEILFLSHALWYGVIMAMTPHGSGFLLIFFINPHTYLYIGVIVTAYDLPRPICYIASGIVLCFGLYRRWYQVPQACYGKSSITLDDYVDALKKVDFDKKDLDLFDKCRRYFPCLNKSSSLPPLENKDKNGGGGDATAYGSVPSLAV
mmetsp:Transcript_22108/g.24606  ORF Transcript_22108/g.24606 Transcript_22108/m.24606 type:complete len:233 (+) Transcript_22108:207-905(+)